MSVYPFDQYHTVMYVPKMTTCAGG